MSCSTCTIEPALMQTKQETQAPLQCNTVRRSFGRSSSTSPFSIMHIARPIHPDGRHLILHYRAHESLDPKTMTYAIATSWLGAWIDDTQLAVSTTIFSTVPPFSGPSPIFCPPPAFLSGIDQFLSKPLVVCTDLLR